MTDEEILLINFLWDQFCKLGEMLGDGDCDPWVGKEYKRLAIVLGVAKPSDFRKPRENNSKQIDDFMQKRIKACRTKRKTLYCRYKQNIGSFCVQGAFPSFERFGMHLFC